MTYNLLKTAAAGKSIANEEAEVAPMVKVTSTGGYWHHILERKPILFTILALVSILIGGIIELVPTFLIKSNIPTIASGKPYTPLELHGRDIYIREGCVSCHSQMIRPFRSEVQRYDPKGGEYSKAGEYVYDHPFLWGSKRTGPDLHRRGGKYADSWHFRHMLTPGEVSTGSCRSLADCAPGPGETDVLHDVVIQQQVDGVAVATQRVVPFKGDGRALNSGSCAGSGCGPG